MLSIKRNAGQGVYVDAYDRDGQPIRMYIQVHKVGDRSARLGFDGHAEFVVTREEIVARDAERDRKQ